MRWNVPAGTFLLLIMLVAAVGRQSHGAGMPVTSIEQIGNVSISRDQPIPVQVRVSDPNGIVAVRCYFRYHPSADFLYVELDKRADGLYQGFLPVPPESGGETEYLYLAVNRLRQVVRSPLFSTAGRGGEQEPATLAESPATIEVYTEHHRVRGKSMLSDDPRIRLKRTEDSDLYGLVAGLYPAGDFPPGAVTEGYFGGFVLQADGTSVPVKGLVPGLSLPDRTLPDLLFSADAADSGSSAQEATDIVGPGIGGDEWTGVCYLLGGRTGGIYEVQPLTAIVTQDGSSVTLTTSDQCFFMYENEVIGTYFWGNIDAVGNLVLFDERIPVQTWTTHWGPVTETSIMIGDFVTPPTEEDPYGDFYVIELKRELPPPPPEPASFLPAVYKLLLPQKTP